MKKNELIRIEIENHLDGRIMLPIYYCKRNNDLRNFLDENIISHSKLAEAMADDQEDAHKWKNRISRFCSITHPQKISDEHWDKIQKAIKTLGY